jgi:hypothetical protein
MLPTELHPGNNQSLVEGVGFDTHTPEHSPKHAALRLLRPSTGHPRASVTEAEISSRPGALLELTPPKEPLQSI